MRTSTDTCFARSSEPSRLAVAGMVTLIVVLELAWLILLGWSLLLLT
ncbi:MAG TPA: hypothetical protein VGQ20_12565 [Acidimicrobiales bacterium]|jgi:hypothetical protein|nr:hypothetical protein [Acidimicrobiales bacterium]